MKVTGVFFYFYFPKFIKKNFLNSSILEIGSLIEGILIHWVKKYGLLSAIGTDIDPNFADAGNEFEIKI